MNIQFTPYPLLRLGGLMLLSVLVASCHALVDQYPEADNLSTADGSTLVIIDARVDRSPPLAYKEVVYDADWRSTERLVSPEPATAMQFKDSLWMRVQLEVYDMKSNSLVDRRVLQFAPDVDAMLLQDTVCLYLPDGDYRVAGWADYVGVDTYDSDLFFATPTLTSVETLTDAYPDDPAMRSCMSGTRDFSIDFTLVPDGRALQSDSDGSSFASRTVEVLLERPVGRFRFLATDEAEFRRRGGILEEVSARICYKQYVAVGYDALRERKNQFVASYEFELPSILDEDTSDELQPLFGDYLFSNPGSETIVLADITLYDGRGQTINSCTNLRIPVMQNRKTTICAPLLTRSASNSGSVDLDEKFEGETIITFN